MKHTLLILLALSVAASACSTSADAGASVYDIGNEAAPVTYSLTVVHS